ncbi:cupin domain-containing protein [Embleya sp. NPDC020886]|uniref:cupin domain-containing protein n=1 Tax=Embleya sp. NPDC020886 TaxID=3363980 RepID=UPI0037A5B3AA
MSSASDAVSGAAFDADSTFDSVSDSVSDSASRSASETRGGPTVSAARLDPPELARVMGLVPHAEGGWYRETWRSRVNVTPPGYPGSRETASAIYYLLCPGEESIWHVVRSAEVWLWHRGGPLELRLGGDGTTPEARPRRVILGPDVEAGEQPQVVIPPGVWQAARPAAGEAVLVSCVVSPAFSFEDFRTL